MAVRRVLEPDRVPAQSDHLADHACLAAGLISCDHAGTRHDQHCAPAETLDAEAIELSREDIHSIDSISPERAATQSPPSGSSVTA